MPSTLFNRTFILHMTTSESRRLNILCRMFNIIASFIITMFVWLYICEGWHFTHMWKHLHDHIISLRGGVWAHKTSLSPPLCIEVPVQRQESKQLCICVFGISILPLSTISIFYFGIVPTVIFFFICFSIKLHNCSCLRLKKLNLH